MSGANFGVRRRLLTLFLGLALTACGPVVLDEAPKGAPGKTVQVALLVPSGTGDAADAAMAADLEKAARMAVTDLGGLIDLKVYAAGTDAASGAAAATKAVAEGAKIIVGPVYAASANGAAVAVAPQGVNVLSLSNNASIAGGNLFVLGTTFDSVATRLTSYAVRQGKRNVFVVSGNNAAEQLGAAAITRAVAGAGGKVAGSYSFEVSQTGVVSAAPKIAEQVKASGADAIFLTSPTDLAIPFLADLLPANGVSNTTTQYIGLARWDIPANAPTLPGLQGGWFALPDPGTYNQFTARYAAAYGSQPHALAGLAYDGIAAVGALVKAGQALDAANLTQGKGFVGVNGVFRLRADGTNQRALAIAQISGGTVKVIEGAPRDFGGAGF